MSQLFKDPSGKHFDYLDSARGIAALMVFAMHFIERKYQVSSTTNYLSIIFNGRDAVSFFFVLSGFVLSYKYIVLGSSLDVKKFYVSRLFRLWPAFFFAVLINCLYVLYHNSELNASGLFGAFLLNKGHFWEEALLLRPYHNFYGPGWTLTIEMTASFLLPFFIVIALKDKRLVPLFVFVFYVVIGQNVVASIHFLLGIYISCNYSQINRASLQQKKWFRYRHFILLAAVAVWPIRYYDNLWNFGSAYHYLAGYLGIDPFSYTSLASAVFLIAIIYYDGAKKFLSNKILVYIGKLSFSIYLVHSLSLRIVYDDIGSLIPFHGPLSFYTLLVITYILFTLTLAMLMHYFVELPFMKVGKRVVGRMKPSVTIEGQRTTVE